MRSHSGDKRHEEIGKLFEYNDWANDRLIEMLEKAFGKETDLYHAEDPRVRAIQETAAHILAAQIIWLRRWQGDSPTALSDPANWPTPKALKRAFEEERAHFWRYFNALVRDAQMTSIIPYKNTRGESHARPLWQMMQHIVFHSAYHRGQVTARLMDLGYEESIVYTDLILFYSEDDAEPR